VQVSVVNTAKIAMGTYHAGVINAGGAALMWGSNLEGQCADGGTSSLSIPTQVSGTTSWSQIACGGWFASGDQYYFSGFTLAITPNGSLYQWGNGSGATPTNIGGSTSFSQVAAGNSNFRGALQTDGTMLLWGANTNSRLGNGTTTDLASPTSILAGVQSFALGGFHGVAIKTDGTLVAWGNSDYGQCGSSGATGTPTATQSGSWSQIACGLYHTAGLRPDGTLWAWGANHFGQLGDNSTTAYRHSPVQIPGSYTAVAAGKYCTLAIKA
jgi:alpha-tubulin suppressor-like RCC1 family protein